MHAPVPASGWPLCPRHGGPCLCMCACVCVPQGIYAWMWAWSWAPPCLGATVARACLPGGPGGNSAGVCVCVPVCACGCMCMRMPAPGCAVFACLYACAWMCMCAVLGVHASLCVRVGIYMWPSVHRHPWCIRRPPPMPGPARHARSGACAPKGGRGGQGGGGGKGGGGRGAHPGPRG